MKVKEILNEATQQLHPAVKKLFNNHSKEEISKMFDKHQESLAPKLGSKNEHINKAKQAVIDAGLGKHLARDDIERIGVSMDKGKTGNSIKLKSYGKTMTKHQDKIVKHLKDHFGSDADVSIRDVSGSGGHAMPTIYVRMKHNKE